MQFIFTCKKTGQSFETDAFRLIDNKGVVSDAHGNTYLDARVELLSPCPFCAKRHIYDVRELACPFTVNK